MFALERQKRITELLKENGSVFVKELSAELGVTEETVRRDLEKLEQQGTLLRTHGGAVPLDENIHELSLEKRKAANTTAKAHMASKAAKFILPGDTIFLDASTTTFYIAKELKKMKNITVVTNSLRVMNELADTPDIKVIAVGGMISRNQSLVGSLAENNIKNNYFVNKMFFSSRGVSAASGILESNEQECAIKQSMMKNATVKIYLCDKTKIDRIGFVQLADISDIDCIVTEKNALTEELETILKEYKTDVVTV